MILNHVRESVEQFFRAKEAQVGAETMRQLEKHIMLTVVDNAWKDHLANMDYLRQGIYLVGYAQQDPKQAFKRESFKLFSDMLNRIKTEVVQMLARIRIRSEEEVAAMEAEQQRMAERLQAQMLATGGGASESAFGAALPAAGGDAGSYQRLPEPDSPKVGRNDPCPCGSGKKYKHCHGQLA
jgi:preprotein translocase subunit SecA